MKQNRFVAGLMALCALLWVVAAIHPLDRAAWILENILLVLFVLVLFWARRRLPLSHVAYVCITLFLILHIVGAHYTYARMPLGLWTMDLFGFSRNHFDRVAHFGFGFFLFLPVRELLLKVGGIRRGWSLGLAAGIILAVSGFFEIVESVVAEIIAPGKGVDWLGGQGDEWDAQNDMLSALLGSIIMLTIVTLAERRKVPR